MKTAVKSIIGKTISGVLVKESPDPTPPASQVFLVFDDGTYYEFFSNSKICGAGGIDEGGMQAAKDYMSTQKIIFEAGK